MVRYIIEYVKAVIVKYVFTLYVLMLYESTSDWAYAVNLPIVSLKNYPAPEIHIGYQILFVLCGTKTIFLLSLVEISFTEYRYVEWFTFA
jgi:hypothetical protein